MIVIFTYKMANDKRLHSLPVYAASMIDARCKFHDRMGRFGCEYDKYSITQHRVIAESGIHFSLATHRRIIDQLSPDDRLAFYLDRETRQLRQKGVADHRTRTFLEHRRNIA